MENWDIMHLNHDPFPLPYNIQHQIVQLIIGLPPFKEISPCCYIITNNNTDLFFQPKVLKRSLNMVSGHSKR